MSAALEASIESIPSIGFSLMDLSNGADFTAAQHYARIIVKQLLADKNIDKHLCLNVNIPNVKTALIKGIKICKQSYAKYDEKCVDAICYMAMDDTMLDPHTIDSPYISKDSINLVV
jgi:5'-nucleotidase